jgi:hypothetical protein
VLDMGSERLLDDVGCDRSTRINWKCWRESMSFYFKSAILSLAGARGHLSEMFFGPFNHWTVLYLPLPTIAVMGCLLGMAGVYRQLRIAPRDRPAGDDSRRPGVLTNLVLALPFFMAVWIVIAMIFVGWIPEVV